MLIIAVAGSTGRTGRLIVEPALRRDLVVRGLYRPKSENPPLPANVTWVRGSIDDEHAMRSLVAGADITISAVGPSPQRTSDTCSTATRNLIAAGCTNLIVVSGMGLTLPYDRKGLGDKIAAAVVRRLSPEVYADKVRELELLQTSDIAWTVVRVGALMDGDEVRPVKVNLLRLPGFAINVGSLAAFCVDEAETRRYPRAAPFVAN
ncbi:MAG: NAD(P)H-binding protein [Devosia sp.]